MAYLVVDRSSPAYPERLRDAPGIPPVLTLSAPLDGSRVVVAIVGAREADPGALSCARDLAAAIAGAGLIVASGGARGIDTAAHEGALATSGVTWCIAPTSPDRVFPTDNAALFKRIESAGSAMVWPFPDKTKSARGQFLIRNHVLAALCDVLVVVQARDRSGSLHSAGCAQRLGRRVRVMQPPAWGDFGGSRHLLKKGFQVVEQVDVLLRELGIKKAAPDARPTDCEPVRATVELEPKAASLLQRVSGSPQHLDEIAHSAGVATSEAATLLLTLALENVVVEGPSGFYRRA